jgi:REP element-mobilizing transposase RayT
MSDHVHICLSIPPKYAVSHVVGYMKGKSAIHIARKFAGRQRNFTGENFWARGYFVRCRPWRAKAKAGSPPAGVGPVRIFAVA